MNADQHPIFARLRSIIIPEQSSRLLKQPLAVSNREDYLIAARPSIVRGRFSTFKRSDVQTFKRFHPPTFQSSTLPASIFNLQYSVDNI